MDNWHATAAAAFALLALASCAPQTPAPGASAQPQVPAIRKGLTIENLGAPVKARTATKASLYTDPNGDPHLFCTLEAYSGLGEDPPYQIYDCNLKTGKARIVDGRTGRPSPHSPFLHTNGKLYIGTSRPPALLEFDPLTGKTRDLGETAPNYFHGTQSFWEDEDGKLYIGHYGLHLGVYDPKADTYTDLGKMSHFKNGYVYSMDKHGERIYIDLKAYGASGMLIYNLRTRKQIHLSEDEKRQAVKGIWKKDGNPLPAELVPPGKKVRFSAWRHLSSGIKSLSQAETIAMELDTSRMRPTHWNDGAVVVRWRKTDEKNWRESRTPGAKVEPNCVKRLAPLPGGKCIGMSAFYGSMFLWDPAAGTSEKLGPAPGSVYDILVDENRVYFSGYPTMFACYDRSKPWTFSRQNTLTDPGQNPFVIQRGGKYNYHLALAANRKVYILGTHTRHSTGASLTIFDPESRKMKHLRDPYTDAQPSDIVALDGGKRMVFGYGNSLVLFDTETEAELKRIPLPEKAGGAGNLLAAGPSSVMGITVRREGDRKSGTYYGILYRADLESGRFAYVRRVKGRPFSGEVEGVDLKSGDRRFPKAPDGCGWLFIGEDLCRIHPADGRVERVIEKPPHKGRMFFIGNDLYIYNGGRQYYNGFAGVLRIRDIFAE